MTWSFFDGNALPALTLVAVWSGPRSVLHVSKDQNGFRRKSKGSNMKTTALIWGLWGHVRGFSFGWGLGSMNQFTSVWQFSHRRFSPKLTDFFFFGLALLQCDPIFSLAIETWRKSVHFTPGLTSSALPWAAECAERVLRYTFQLLLFCLFFLLRYPVPFFDAKIYGEAGCFCWGFLHDHKPSWPNSICLLFACLIRPFLVRFPQLGVIAVPPAPR